MRKLGLSAVVGLLVFRAALAVPFADIGGREQSSKPSDAVVTYGAVSDATVKLTGGEGGFYAANFNLWVTNCTVTIDASDVSAADLITFTGDIVTFGTGKVIVSGVDKAAFGEFGGSAPTLTSMSILDADISFAAGGELVLTNTLTLARRPPCSFSIAPNACLGVIGENVLGDAQSGLDIDHFDLIVLDESGSGQSVAGPITVRSGRWLSYKACGIICDKANHIYTWSGGNGTLANDVHLEANAKLYVPMRGNCSGTLGGRLTGAGQIALATYNGALTFAGDGSAFMGDIVVNIADRPLAVSGAWTCGNLTLGAAGTTLTLAEGASFTVSDKVTGTVTVSGEGALSIGALAEEAMVCVNGSVQTTMPTTDVLELQSVNSRIYAKCGTEGNICDLSAVRNLLGTKSYELVAQNDVSYVNLPRNVQLTVGAGVTATLLTATETNAVKVVEGGKLIVDDGTDCFWRAHVAKWIDPNVAESITGLTNGNNNVVRTRVDDSCLPWYKSNVKFAEIDTITDRRADCRDWVFQCEKVFSNPTSGIVPLLATNALNGLSVLSFGAGYYARRVSYWACPPEVARDETTRPDKMKFLPKFAVLVFGSQGGGGQGLFGNSNSYFKRGGAKSASPHASGIDWYDAGQPIFANDIPTWADGVQINAQETSFADIGRDGWQVLSVDCSGAVNGVAALGNYGSSESKAASGGQIYGEILFFDVVLSDVDRTAAERYLAEKWGLADQYRGAAPGVKCVRVEGEGEVLLNVDATLAGSFDGVVNVNGKTLAISDEPLPPGEEVVTAANPARWFDPEWPGALQTTTYGIQKGAVQNFFDRLLGCTSVDDLADGAIYLNACGRYGWLDVGSRGGWATNWISYIGCTGNLRFREKGDPTGDTNVYEPMNVKSIFLVQDSTYGGGTPFQTTKGGAQRIWRGKGEAPTGHEVEVPIWNGTDDKGNFVYTALRDMDKATTRLDGKIVDGAVQGFGGKPEVLSAISTEAFPIGTFANLYYNNDGGEPYPMDCGEVQSEIILFANAIAEADRAKIEAYLAWKWLGEVREGYTMMSGAQMTGSGRVTVPEGSPAPQFGADFTGTATYAADRVDFTVTAADPAVRVEGFVDVGQGTFAPSSPCTLSVTVADGVRLRSESFYPLVRGRIAEGVQIDLAMAASAAGRRRLTLATRDGRLGLLVGAVGFKLYIK